MLFPHEDIVFALSGDIKNRDHFEAVYKKLVLDRPDGPDKRALGDDYPDIFKLFLTEDLPSSKEKDIPTLEVVQKIVFKLTTIAERHGAQIRNFYWWDIRPKLRALVASLTRDGHTFQVYFYWKKTNKDEVHPLNRGCKCACSISPNMPGGLRLEFDAEAYQEMRAAYEYWLKSPLVLPRDYSEATISGAN